MLLRVSFDVQLDCKNNRERISIYLRFSFTFHDPSISILIRKRQKLTNKLNANGLCFTLRDCVKPTSRFFLIQHQKVHPQGSPPYGIPISMTKNGQNTKLIKVKRKLERTSRFIVPINVAENSIYELIMRQNFGQIEPLWRFFGESIYVENEIQNKWRFVKFFLVSSTFWKFLHEIWAFEALNYFIAIAKKKGKENKKGKKGFMVTKEILLLWTTKGLLKIAHFEIFRNPLNTFLVPPHKRHN